MQKEKMKLKSRLTWVYFLFFITFTACQNEDNEARRLPYIGKHDIATHEADGYQKGDTIYHVVPEFNYLTHDSTWLQTNDIDDKVWIVKFFFAKCPTICPPMTSSMKNVYQELDDLNEDLVFLSFTIDPKNDTPKALRDYRNLHGIEADNWYFLTGEEAETHELGVEGFYVHALADEDAPGGFAHSSTFVLVDKNQNIRGVYDGLDPKQVDKLIEDVNILFKK